MKKILLLCFVFLLNYSGNTQELTQGFDLKSETLLLPRVIKPYEFNLSLGVVFTRVPFDWVETALQAPLFNIHATYGLPLGFSATGDFTTLLITNELRIGPRWNCEYKKISFNIGLDAEYAYGRLGFAGFDSWINGWFLYPGIALGYRLKDVALSLQFDLSNLLHIYGTVGDVGATKSSPMFNGGSLTLASEQRYFKTRVCAVGFKALYVKYFFPAWAAYPTFNRYYFLPQFFVSFKM